MARFIKSMMELKALEFNSASNVLHHNKGEYGYTYFGIYQTSHPKWAGWREVYRLIIKYKYRLRDASRVLYKDASLTKKVYAFYKEEYWIPLKLDFLNSQKMADEIFVFSVNTNPKKAIKKAQKIVGVKVDGWIGVKTIKALNEFSEKKFDIQFDLAEIAFYKYLAFGKNSRRYRRFYDGWVNRARAV